jgi:DNA-binding response OmpR family regulator
MEAAESPSDFYTRPAMNPLHVLIVEDYRDTADLLARWVALAGHDSRVCHTGFQAEQLVTEYRPDVVLLDIGLPDTDGWELAPFLRRANPAMKIFAVTAYQSLDDRQRSHDAGIDLHLGKPLRRETILSLLSLPTAS